MKDENGKKLSEKKILYAALEHLSEACCLLFELESDAGIAAAFLADSTLRYAQAIYNNHDPRLSEEFINENKIQSR